VSLAKLLTIPRLRSRAAWSFARGEHYFDAGNVAELRIVDDALEGVVTGNEIYKVRVMAVNDRLFSTCTCPVGDDFCKHAVALSLAYIAGAETVSALAERTSAGPVFKSDDELLRWASEHGVTHELDVRADVLGPALHEAIPNMRSALPHLLQRWSIRDIASLDRSERFIAVTTLRSPVAEEARRYLENAAADIEVGLAEEKDTRKPPKEPALVELARRLWDVRAMLRTNSSPRSRAARAAGALGFDAKESRLMWREPTMIRPAINPWGAGHVESGLGWSPALHHGCTCQRKGCAHVLALVDAALDYVHDPGKVAESVRVAEELLRPPWERALAELAAHETVVAKPKTDIEVWWLVDTEFSAHTLTPLVKKQLKKGGMSAGSRMSALKLLDDYSDALGETDLAIAQHLAAWEPGRKTTYPARAFALLAGHPRVALADEPDVSLSVRRLPLGFTALPAGKEIRIEPSVDGARFSPRLLEPLLKLHAIGEPLVIVEAEQQRMLLLDVPDEARRLFGVLAKYGDTFPPESQDQLMNRLALLDRALPIAIPESLLGSQLRDRPTVVVRLRLTYEGTLELEPFVRPAVGAPLYPPGAGPRDVLVARDGERAYARRDLGAELVLVAGVLARLPLEAAVEGPPGCYQISDVDAALTLVDAIQHPPDGLEAEWVDKRQTIVKSGGTSSMNISVERKRDWFGIEGELKIEAGRIELAVLLDAARQQRKFVRLDDTRWVELSEEVRQKLTQIADRTWVTKNSLELSPGAVPIIHALAASGANVETAPSWQLLAERLAVAERLRPKPPGTLEAKLRPYQVEGHAWLARLAAWGAGACLADDMGLGKTIQAISLLLDRTKQGPALVVAPTSVTLNWVDELRRFAPSLRPVIYGEAPDRAACIATLKKADVLIASYGLLVRDIEMLAKKPFGTLIFDEAQALKNPTTQRAKAARALDSGFRVALSGTPLENHLGELWSLFAIIFPGLLGSFEQFRTRFGLPIERDKNPEARAALSRLIKPFLLRRTKAEVAQDLPPRIEIQVPIALSTDEAQLYEDARLAALAQIGKGAKKTKKEDMTDAQRRFQVLAALTRLRLLASHPKLYDPESAVQSSKMQRMVELVEELRSEGHRALIFSQFTSHLALARQALDAAGVTQLYLDGATTARARAELIERFQGGEGDVFLISLKAGGTGINLTAADYVIHLDPWWNPAVEDQATDRAHRIGQTKPVTVYRLVSRGTVEEKILSMHGDKRALVAGVLDGTSAAGKLTTRDLLALVGDEPLIASAVRRTVDDDLTN